MGILNVSVLPSVVDLLCLAPGATLRFGCQCPFQAIAVLCLLYISSMILFGPAARTPKEIPWIGLRDYTLFPRVRASINSIFHTRQHLEEGYEKVRPTQAVPAI
jgi:hypothetical protein